ncbi:MAG: alpha/beta fold hydrolase [Ilumatobacteraceae bacterium]
MSIPWLPTGRTVVVPGRGEFFIRQFVHSNPAAPTLLLLHGWTANTDLQFFTAYRQMADKYSFIGIDHRGHGRGLRSSAPFSLEDCADDAAAVLNTLGISQVVTVGYSMGGPISMLLGRRHRHLVRAMVLQATALEWRATRRERNHWRIFRIAAPILRHLSSPRFIRSRVKKIISRKSEVFEYLDWIVGEIRRNDAWTIGQAGRTLGRYDARTWAHELGIPTVTVVTTRDRLVSPVKQHSLAEILQAETILVDGDHIVTLVSPQNYSSTTCNAIDQVLLSAP